MTILPTQRQLEVLLMRANGMTNAEIAADLKIRPDSVSVILTRYCRKVGASNTTHAVAVAVAIGDIGVHQIVIPNNAQEDAA